MIEAISIRHELGGWYYFMFDEKCDDSTLEGARMFISEWALERGKTVKKSKHKDYPSDNRFEVGACLIPAPQKIAA